MRNQLLKSSLSSKGFTLVEVMVALAIVAMALPALMMLVMAQIDGAAHIRNKTYAMWIAENELTRLNLLNNKERFPNFKLAEKDSGKTELMGLQWQWRYEISKADEIPVEGVVKIDIDVGVIGLAEEGAGFKGVSDSSKLDSLVRLTGYMSE